MFESDTAIDKTYQIRAGKLRRYAGQSRLRKITDFKTWYLNLRDAFYTLGGYRQARKLLKEVRPDGILIKGGFVGVPVGLAAARLHLPFITHDSDSVPGLANRIIARWALMHATGMPVEFYDYPKEKTVYTGTPVSAKFELLGADMRTLYRADIGLKDSKHVITVIGGSQGADELNRDFISIVGRLMQKHQGVGIVHIVGQKHVGSALKAYKKELLADEFRNVVVEGFVEDAYRYTGAADIVVTRASATVIAELAIQGQASIVVPGQLAGNHQQHNADKLKKDGLTEEVAYGDAEGLFLAVNDLLTDSAKRNELAKNLHGIAKPAAASELAGLLLSSFTKEKANGGV